MRRKRLIAVAVLVLAVPAATGTGSFSAMTAERGVDIAVAGDDNAFLGISQKGGEGVVGGESFTLLALTDRFSGELRLSSVTTESSLVTIDTSPPIDIGDEEQVTPVRANCDTAGSGAVTVSIVATGTDASVELERTVEVSCKHQQTKTATATPEP